MKKSLIVAATVVALAPLLAAAQPTNIPGGFEVPNIPEEVNLAATITNVLYFVFAILIAIAAIFIVYSAFLYLTSGGDEEKLEKAKKFLIYAIVAVVVALAGRGLLLIATQLLVTT